MMAPVDQRPIETPKQAEALAAAWMRTAGYRDAQLTGASADDGIDVRAGRALAQVKKYNKPVGVNAMRELFGARGHDTDKALLFFASAANGYGQPARDYADKHDIALFAYDLYGNVRPVNRSAQHIVRTASGGIDQLADRGPQVQAGTKPAGTGCATVLAALLAVYGVVLAAQAVKVPVADRAVSVGAACLVLFVALCMAAGVVVLRRERRPARLANEPAGPRGTAVGANYIAAHERERAARTETGALVDPSAGTDAILDSGDVSWFDYPVPPEAVGEALFAIHALGGGRQAVVDDEKFRITIAPDWVKEYAGLVSLTAELDAYVLDGVELIRVRWSTSSQASSPSAVEQVADAAHAAAERANNALAEIVGRWTSAG